jgi:hypothetical protein
MVAIIVKPHLNRLLAACPCLIILIFSIFSLTKIPIAYAQVNAAIAIKKQFFHAF